MSEINENSATPTIEYVENTVGSYTYRMKKDSGKTYSKDGQVDFEDSNSNAAVDFMKTALSEYNEPSQKTVNNITNEITNNLVTKVVNVLPESEEAEEGVIYLVKNEQAEEDSDDKYYEFIFVNGDYEKFTGVYPTA